MTNYYKTLGLKDFASSEEIKIAYRKLSKKLHPDVNDGDKFFEERFVEIQEAYEFLSDSRKRLSYDEDLKESLATDNNIDLQKLQNTLYKKYSGGHSQKKIVFFKPNLSKSATIMVIVSSLLFSIFLYLLAEEEKMLQKAQSVERIKEHRFSIGSTRKEVFEVQGHSTKSYVFDSVEIWYYRESSVTFINGRVSQFSNDNGNLKVISTNSNK